MRLSRFFAVSLTLGALWLLAAPAARADQAWRTPLRLTEPTEIPGKVLPPGEYVVKVVNTQETRSIVQFFNANETEVQATVLAVPNYRVKSTSQTEFLYFQRIEGSPQALKSWVYPGNNYGVEFVYPKAEATRLAEGTRETVFATPTTEEPTLRSEVIAVTPERKEVPFTEYQAEKPMPKTLPKTGSHLPLIGLLAAASLAGAVGLKIAGRTF